MNGQVLQLLSSMGNTGEVFGRTRESQTFCFLGYPKASLPSGIKRLLPDGRYVRCQLEISELGKRKMFWLLPLVSVSGKQKIQVADESVALGQITLSFAYFSLARILACLLQNGCLLCCCTRTIMNCNIP